jgi:hypothetical protein
MEETKEKVSLVKYFDMRIENIEQNTKIALASADKRLDGMNEFRDTLKDQANTFATRKEVDLQVSKMEEDIKMLTASKNILEGKASQSSVIIAYIISAISIIIAVASLVLNLLGK